MANLSPLCQDSHLVQVGYNNSLKRNPEYVTTNLVIFVLFSVINTMCLCLFALFKHRFERTRLRRSFMVGLMFLSVEAVMTGTNLPIYLNDQFPCWLGNISFVITCPLAGSAIITKLLMFFFLSKFTERAQATAVENAAQYGYASGNQDATLTFGKSLHVLKIMALSIFGDYETKSEDLFALRFISSRAGSLLIALIIIFPFGLVAIGLSVKSPEVLYCYNCAFDPSLELTLIIINIILIGFAALVYYKVRKFPDPWGLRGETFWCLVFAVFAYVGFLLGNTTGIYGWFAFIYFLELGFLLMMIEQSVVQIYLGYRNEKERHKRKSRKVIEDAGNNNGSVVVVNTYYSSNNKTFGVLDQIMEDPQLGAAFEKHLVSELGLESLLFIRDVVVWEKSYFDISAGARKARAKKIYKTYIDSRGVFAVNIPHNIIHDVKTNLDAKGDDAVKDSLFTEAVIEVKRLMQHGAVKRFLLTAAYKNLQTAGHLVVVEY